MGMVYGNGIWVTVYGIWLLVYGDPVDDVFLIFDHKPYCSLP